MPSFRGMQSMYPESRGSPMCNCISEVRADALPGMTTEELVQIDIEFVSAVAADQCQFERRTFGIRTGRYAFQLEGEALDPGRAVFEQFRNRQSPVRRRPFDKQADVPGVGADHVDHNGGFAVTPDVANG